MLYIKNWTASRPLSFAPGVLQPCPHPFLLPRKQGWTVEITVEIKTTEAQTNKEGEPQMRDSPYYFW